MRWFAIIALTLVAAAIGCSDDGKGGPADGGVDQVFEVAAGDFFAIRIAATGELIPEEIVDPYDQLSETAASAVDITPEWIADDLARTLARLTPEDADVYAEQILAAEELWVDEVAWAITAVDAPILHWTASYSAAPLFLENAEGIYSLAGQLSYAELVELGDGRTTLHLTGENGEYDLDPDIYYHYVVHPRSYMDLPAYEQGHFWRTLFLEDSTYGENLVDSVASSPTVQAAADAVGDWIQGFMTFQYGTNDLQPVDIYYATIGSCGQYAIITNAAARTMLIPTAAATARADDHEWSEFWDGRWIHWDNSLGDMANDNPHYPYIDWPEIYDNDTYNGSGVFGEVAHIARFRPDENVFQSEIYFPYKEVTLAVTDAAGEPVEGARILANSLDPAQMGGVCTWEYTDGFGEATLYLGDGLLYTFTAEHDDLGTATALASGASLWIDDNYDEPVLDGMSFPAAYERTLTNAGASPGGKRPVSLTHTVASTLQHRSNYITEGYDLGHTYPTELEGGVIDVYVTDAAGLTALEGGQQVSAWAVSLAQPTATVELAIPKGEDWYVVLDNTNWPLSDKHVTVTLSTGK